MNEEYILSKIKTYLNEQGMLGEDDFSKLFGALSLHQQYQVICIMIKYNIDIDYINLSMKESAERKKNKKTSTGKLDRLTNEELCIMYQQGNKTALEALVKNNMRLVGSRVNRYKNIYSHKLDDDDLFQCGVIGMIKAAAKFNLEAQASFTTYATWWIDQSILRNIMNYGFTIRIPAHRFEEVSKLLKVLRRHPNSTKEQIYEIINEERNISRKKFESLLFLSQNILSIASLNSYIGEDKETELVDVRIDENSPTVEEIVERRALKQALDDVLKTIGSREEKVIRLRFGLDDGKRITLEQVGNEFSVTRERIRQIEAKALRRLRHPSRSKKLKDFM
jgi:RNA polymerase primary sigma factor